MGTKFVLYITGLLTIGCIILLGFSVSNSLPVQNTGWCGTDTSTPFFTKEVNVELGKSLFKMNCKQCHNPSMKDDMTGPALGGLMARWNQDTLSLYSFIQDPVSFSSNSKDPRIRAINDWAPSQMNAFPLLTYEEVRSIVEYIAWQEFKY